MQTRITIPLLIAVLAAVVALLTGCYGPSPTLNPTVKLTVDETHNWPYFPAGGVLYIKGEATTADETGNPVISTVWTQRSNSGVLGEFLINSPNSLENVWQAPAPNLVVANTPIDLVLTTGTAQGGQSVTTLHLIITPSGMQPVYNFAGATVLAALNLKQGTALDINGTVDLKDPLQYSVASYEWTQNPAIGAFNNTTIDQPKWFAPNLAQDSNGNFIPQTTQLSVKVTNNVGYSSTSTLLVNVVP